MRRYLGFTSKVYGVISLFLMIASEIAFLGTVSFCRRFFSFILSFFPNYFWVELFHRNNSGAHGGSRELRTILSRKGQELKMIFCGHWPVIVLLYSWSVTWLSQVSVRLVLSVELAFLLKI